jgi:hypothetical protein
MSYFLVIYDRHRQLKPVIERVTDSAGAQERLFEIEAELGDDPDRGVVLLVADGEDDLRKTHGQYFERVDDLRRLVTS